jgi:hypothetical protein
MGVTDQFYIALRLVAALRSQWWSAVRIREHQDAALLRIMRHAVAHVPFYRVAGTERQVRRLRPCVRRFRRCAYMKDTWDRLAMDGDALPPRFFFDYCRFSRFIGEAARP